MVSRGSGSTSQRPPGRAEVRVWRPINVRCHLGRATQLATHSGSGLVELAAFVGTAPDLASEPRLLGEEFLRTLTTLAWIDGGQVERVSSSGLGEVTTSSIGSSALAAANEGKEQSRELTIPLGSRAGDQFNLRVIPKQTAEAAVGCGAMVRMVLALTGRRPNAQAPPDVNTARSEIEVLRNGKNVFQSPSMVALLAAVKQIASQNLTVLLTGESGTGKEVIANLIHEAGGPPSRPFVVFNCATVPTDMIESQLFGYRRGAFTGAVDSFLGVIRAAEGGTLFLDEIAELPISTQPKLLRFLDSLEIQPLGEALPYRVKVRIIAATNADLEERVKDGRFRPDLYYRLDIVHFHLPPLRERREDIRPLAESFLARATAEIGKAGVTFGEDALEHLLLDPWPGNVRQLLHEVRRIAAFIEPGATVRPEHLGVRPLPNSSPRTSVRPGSANTIRISLDGPLNEVIRQVEAAALRNALVASNWRNDVAANRLGLSRKGLYLKRRRLGLDHTRGCTAGQEP